MITVQTEYHRLVDRAFDTIRQAGAGMPAIMIRQLDALAKVMVDTTSDEQRRVLLAQGVMVMRLAEASVGEPGDLADVQVRYAALIVVDPRRAGSDGDRGDHGAMNRRSVARRSAPFRDAGLWKSARRAAL